MSEVARVTTIDKSVSSTPVYCWDKFGGGPSDFKPIPNSEAITQVDAFREYEKTHPDAIASEYGRGVIHRPAALMNYLTNVYCTIVDVQPPLGTEFKEYSWGVGHFFMMDDNDEVGFCVAPILFKPSATNPTKTDVLDPFDKNCKYQYTYGVNAINAEDDDEVFYDMGEMWP